jgi:hypothetical protein
MGSRRCRPIHRHYHSAPPLALFLLSSGWKIHGGGRGGLKPERTRDRHRQVAQLIYPRGPTPGMHNEERREATRVTWSDPVGFTGRFPNKRLYHTAPGSCGLYPRRLGILSHGVLAPVLFPRSYFVPFFFCPQPSSCTALGRLSLP